MQVPPEKEQDDETAVDFYRKTPIGKSKKKAMTSQILLKNIADCKSESESEIEGELESEQHNEGQYIVLQYQGKCDILYFAAVITEVDEEEELYRDIL